MTPAQQFPGRSTLQAKQSADATVSPGSSLSSVRAQLVLLAAAVAAPLILLSGASVWYAYSSQRAQRQAMLLSRAQAAASMVDQRFNSSLSALHVLASSRLLARGDLDGFEDTMREASAELGGALISLTDSQGEVARTTLWPPGPRKPGVRASDFLLSALHANRAEISGLVIGPQSHRAEIGVAVPVHSTTGKPAWALSLYLPPGSLEQDLHGLHLPPGWFASVLDRENHVVARSRDEERFLGQLATPEVIAARKRRTRGIVDAGHRTLDGAWTLTAFARAPLSGYEAIINIPEAEFAAPLRATLLRTAALALLLTALGICAALLLSRRIVKALRAVAELAPGTTPRSGLREIDELAQAIANADARRHESEARLEMAAEAGGIGIWDWNLPDKCFTYSERAKAICGFPSGQPVSFEMVRDVTHPEDRPRISAMCQRALDPALREVVPHEYRIVRSNGEARWVLAQGTVIFADTDGAVRPLRYVGTIQDITERKQAEQALRDSESRLRLAVTAGRMAVWEYVTATGAVTGSSDLYCLLGFPEDVTPSMDDIRARYAPGERERLRSAAQAALARGDRFFELEYGHLWPDGSLRWLMLRAEFILQDGMPVRIVGVVMDVTDRRKIQAELRGNEAALRDLLATIDLAAVFVREWNGRIRFWSRGCEQLYGWTAAEAVGRSSHDLLSVAFPVPLAEIEASLLEQGAWEGDVLHHHRDGTALTMSVRKALRRGDDGGPPVVMESVADVTALREAEGQLRTLNQHLEARVRAEVEARETAQIRAAQAERVQALGQLAGGIAHDFNNVLQAVMGGASMIERRARDIERVRQLSKMVLDAAQRGASVTRRLLVFARRTDLKTEPLDPAALLHGMREMLEPTLGGRIRIETDVEAGLPPLLADQGQLETALVNLAVNARDAMSEPGILTLSARAEIIAESEHKGGLPPGRYVALTLADTGTGMDAATLARATEPFFTTKGPGKGTGLGLAMTRGFVEQSRGSLRIVSTPGKGTSVTLWLPAAKEQSEAETADASRTMEPAPCTAHVLLVDDDDHVRESLAAGLTDLGFHVQTAPSAEAALALIRQGEPVECLVTDLSMPGMNGVSLVHAARSLHSGLPAIVLTGYAGHEALADGAAAMPSYAVLWKPADPARIARRVSELLCGETAEMRISQPEMQTGAIT